MRITACLRQEAIGVTMFTRRNCSLCETAKAVLQKVHKRRNFQFEEIDVMQTGHEQWKVYEFDTPVIHVQRVSQPLETVGHQTKGDVVKECGKLMHRFTEDQVEDLMDEAEKP